MAEQRDPMSDEEWRRQREQSDRGIKIGLSFVGVALVVGITVAHFQGIEFGLNAGIMAGTVTAIFLIFKKERRTRWFIPLLTTFIAANVATLILLKALHLDRTTLEVIGRFGWIEFFVFIALAHVCASRWGGSNP